mmetsp:Transcript_22593/g.67967  ORF Transcript_22593/g.67967 Transcript_22593/m.67967 type:complete len:236 (+) Transcript_22593:1257-1964(+)
MAAMMSMTRSVGLNVKWSAVAPTTLRVSTTVRWPLATDAEITWTVCCSTVPGRWLPSFRSDTAPVPSTTTVYGSSPMSSAPNPTPNHTADGPVSVIVTRPVDPETLSRRTTAPPSVPAVPATSEVGPTSQHAVELALVLNVAVAAMVVAAAAPRPPATSEQPAGADESPTTRVAMDPPAVPTRSAAAAKQSAAVATLLAQRFFCGAGDGPLPQLPRQPVTMPAVLVVSARPPHRT